MKEIITKTTGDLNKALEANDKVKGFISEAIASLTKAAEAMRMNGEQAETMRVNGHIPDRGVYAVRYDGPKKIFIPLDDLEKMKFDGDSLEDIDDIAVISDFCSFRIKKKMVEGDFDFNEAQRKAAEFGDGWRCPSRHECIELYNARFAGLDWALELLGGDSIKGNLIWTCEAAPNPEYNPYGAFYPGSAFYVGDGGGNISAGSESLSCRVRLLSAL